jgi:hypothetical protein
MLFIFTIHATAEDFKYSFRNTINTKIENKNKVLIKKFDKTIYYLDNQPKKLVIFKCSVDSSNIKKFAVINIHTKINPKDFEIIDNNIFILTYNKIYKYTKKGSHFFLEKEINATGYSKLYLHTKNNLLLYKNYNYCLGDEKIDSEISIFNYQNGKLIKSIQFEFNYIFFTHFTGEYFDYNRRNKSFSISQTIPYKIDFYDSLLNKIDNSIIGKNLYSNSKRLHEIDILNKKRKIEQPCTIKEVIYMVQPLDDSLKRIFRTYYINDSTFLVCKSDTFSYKNYVLIDIWNKKENNWILKVSDKKILTEMKPDLNSLDYLRIMFTNSNPIIITDQAIIYLNNTWIEFVKDEPFEQYLKRGYQYLKSNKNNYAIDIFQWNVE